MSGLLNLKLTDEQTEALIRELSQIIENDRYPLSPRIRVLKEILGMMRPGARSPGTAAPSTSSGCRKASGRDIVHQRPPHAAARGGLAPPLTRDGRRPAKKPTISAFHRTCGDESVCLAWRQCG
jgi:hypothetical protein